MHYYLVAVVMLPLVYSKLLATYILSNIPFKSHVHSSKCSLERLEIINVESIEYKNDKK